MSPEPAFESGDPTPADVAPDTTTTDGERTTAAAPRVLILTAEADRDAALASLAAAAAVDGWTIEISDAPAARAKHAADARFLLPVAVTVVVTAGDDAYPDARQVLRRARADDPSGLRGVVVDAARTLD